MKHPNQVVKRFQSSLLHCLFFFSIVLLITGGYKRVPLSSVEIFDPNNVSLSCSLPNMTVDRYYPASVGLVVCGGKNINPDGGWGDDAGTTCETLDTDTGLWNISHTLKEKRGGHVMWRTPSGKIMLMGGWDSENTTEVLKDDGSSEYGFNLKHRTKYVDMCL